MTSALPVEVEEKLKVYRSLQTGLNYYWWNFSCRTYFPYIYNLSAVDKLFIVICGDRHLISIILIVKIYRQYMGENSWHWVSSMKTLWSKGWEPQILLLNYVCIWLSRVQYIILIDFNVQELDLLPADSQVMKLVGPILITVDLEEARENVGKRLEFIEAEVHKIDAAIGLWWTETTLFVNYFTVTCDIVKYKKQLFSLLLSSCHLISTTHYFKLFGHDICNPTHTNVTFSDAKM